MNKSAFPLPKVVIASFFRNSSGVWFPKEALKGLSLEEIHDYVLRTVMMDYPDVKREQMVISHFVAGTLVIIMDKEHNKKTLSVLE